MNEQKIKELAVKFGTPSYIFDTESVAARAGRIREILGDRIHLCYSIKANRENPGNPRRPDSSVLLDQGESVPCFCDTAVCGQA